MEVLIPVGVVAVVLLAFVFWTYNRLISLRNMIAESWRNVDTELQRRYDLIPNLVETVKGYAKHEREVFEQVVKARSQAVASTGDPASQARDENVLVRALGRLFAVVESYPELRTSRNFLHLQGELVNTEDRIQAARRFYNGNVRTYNNKVQMFPSNIIASISGFTVAEYFEIESVSVREAPKVSV